MFKCDICGRELKSKAGLTRHRNSCEKKAIIPDTDAMILDIEKKVIELELVGTESDYYQGHPKRLIKLKGLKSRTFDKHEQAKIQSMIDGLLYENR